MKHEVTVELHGGKSIHFETGKLAKQAHGSCIVRIGDNVVLATACANPDPREGIDFFPLTVDYREYTYAAGRIPGGFIKREGRPSEREILTSRQIDRPIRPLFPEGFRCETQVIAMVLSADTTNDPDVAGINGASVALSVSDIPFHGPIGAVRVGQVDGNFVINPTYDEQRAGKLNLMVVGTADGIVMIESGAKEVSEETVVQGIEFGHEQIKKICAAISDLAKKVGKPKRTVEPVVTDEAYLGELTFQVWRAAAGCGQYREASQERKLRAHQAAQRRNQERGSRRRRSWPQESQQVFRSPARADLPRAGDQRSSPSRRT